MQDSEGTELDNSQIVCDKVLDKDRNALDKDIDQRYENAYLDVSECLRDLMRFWIKTVRGRMIPQAIV